MKLPIQTGTCLVTLLLRKDVFYKDAMLSIGFMVLNATSTKFQLCRGGQFYW